MSLHRRLNQMVESLEADLDGQVDNDLLVQDLMSFAGDAASLESRIAALTAELVEAHRLLELEMARVKEWEQAYDSAGFGPQIPSEVQVFLRERDRVNGQVAALRVSAAESALASARELLTRWITWLKGKDNRRALIADTRAWLSSAPSPAPERSDKRSRWNDLGELPVTVMATSEYPSPAPCSGCEAARELLESAGTGNALLWDRRRKAWLKERP